MGSQAALKDFQLVTKTDLPRRVASKTPVDTLALAKFSIKLDKLLHAENVFSKRLTGFLSQCCGTVPVTGSEVLSERERHFPSVLLAARVYEHLLCSQQRKLEKEFAEQQGRSMAEELRHLGRRIQRKPAALKAVLWKQLSQETQRLTTNRASELSISVTAVSAWDSYAWSDDCAEWIKIGAKSGHHERALSSADWLDAISKKVLGTPGAVDRRDGSLNLDKIPDVAELLKLAIYLAPAYVRARRDFFVTQLCQQLRYVTDQSTRFVMVEGVEMPQNTAILHLVLGFPEVLFAEVRRYRESQRRP